MPTPKETHTVWYKTLRQKKSDKLRILCFMLIGTLFLFYFLHYNLNLTIKIILQTENV
jgi:hypothetical protein